MTLEDGKMNLEASTFSSLPLIHETETTDMLFKLIGTSTLSINL